MNKKIGILGGLGPEATVDLYKKIIKQTPAKIDQDHIETIIISNPKIPDRTKAILHGGESPLSSLISTAKTLQATGVNNILIPCNTAHYYFDELQAEIDIPIIHMIRETVRDIKLQYPHVKKVGILATTATLQTKIYERELSAHNIDIIVPEEDIQENFVMEAIQGIKAGLKKKPRTLLKYSSIHLAGKGAEIIIQGCTEVALVLNKKNCEQILIDPAIVIAKRAIEISLDKSQSQISLSSIKTQVTGGR